MYTYTIGGKTYRQTPLVWGQIEQLLGVIDGVQFSSLDPLAIIAALGNRISQAVAVVLIPEGETAASKTRDIRRLADELAFDLDPATLMEIVADFFGCNPIASLSGKLAETVTRIRESLPTSSPTASSSSLEAT